MDTERLDAMIAAASDDPAARATLVAALRGAKLAIPLDHGLVDGQLPPETRPLTLGGPAGFPVLASFSAVGKASPWLERHPDYAHVLFTSADWVLRFVQPPFGLAVNPGYRYSLLLTPDEVRALCEAPASDGA